MMNQKRRFEKLIAMLLVMMFLLTPTQQILSQEHIDPSISGITDDRQTEEQSGFPVATPSWEFGPIDFEEGADQIGQIPSYVWVQNGSGMSGTYQNYGEDNIAFEFRKTAIDTSGEMDFPVPAETENRAGKLVYEFDMAANTYDTQWRFLLDYDYIKYPLFEFHRDTLGYVNVFNHRGSAETITDFGVLDADTTYNMMLVLDMEHATQSLFIDGQAVYLNVSISELPTGGSYRTIKAENTIGSWGAADAAIYFDNMKSYEYVGVPDDTPAAVPTETPVFTPAPTESDDITFGDTPMASVTFRDLNAYSAPGMFWGIGNQDAPGRLDIVADPADPSNMVLQITDLKNPTTYLNFEPESPQPADTVFAFKLRAPAYGFYGNGWNIRYRTQNDEEKPLFALHGWEDGNLDRIFITAGEAPMPTLVDLHTDTWYSFQIVFHYEAGTFDLLVNGEEAARDVEIPGGLGTNVKCLSFMNNRQEDDTRTLYLDDLRCEVLQVEPTPTPTATPPEPTDDPQEAGEPDGPGDERYNTILGKFSLMPLAATDGTPQYWFENSFDLPAGQLPSSGYWNLPAPYDTYNNHYGDAYTVREIVNEPGRDGVLKLTKNNSANKENSFIVYRNSSDHPEIAETELFVYEFDFKISDRSHNWMFGFGSMDFVTIPNANFGQGIRDGIGDLWVSQNRWNKLSLEINTVNNTYSVYLNGYKVKEDIPALYDLSGGILSRFMFKSNYQEAGSTSDSSLYVDNFVAYPAKVLPQQVPNPAKTVWFENTYDDLSIQTLPSELGFWNLDAPEGSQYDTYVNNWGNSNTKREIVAESGRGNVLKLTKSKDPQSRAFKVWRGVWDNKYPLPDIHQANEFVYELDFKTNGSGHNWEFGFNDYAFVVIPSSYFAPWAGLNTKNLAVNENSWNRLKIEVTKSTNTYNIYLNGGKVASDLRAPFDLMTKKLQYFSFSSNYYEPLSTTNASLSIDNFKGYSQTSIGLGEALYDTFGTTSGEKWYSFRHNDDSPVEITLDQVPDHYGLELYDDRFQLVSDYVHVKKDRAVEITANINAGLYHIKVIGNQDDQEFSSEAYRLAINSGERILKADQSHSIQADGAATFVFQPKVKAVYRITTTGAAKTGSLFNLFKDGNAIENDDDQQTDFSVQSEMSAKNKYYIKINESGDYNISITRVQDPLNITFSAESVQAASGGEVSVPIHLSNMASKDIVQVALKLDYDKEKINTVNIVPTQGYMFYKVNESEIVISSADLNGDMNYFTDGKLCDVKVCVAGNAGDTIPITISQATANTESDIVYPNVSAGSVFIQDGKAVRSAYAAAPVFANDKLYFKKDGNWIEFTRENILEDAGDAPYLMNGAQNASNAPLTLTDPLNDERQVYDGNRDGIVDETDAEWVLETIRNSPAVDLETGYQEPSVSLETKLVLCPDYFQGTCHPTLADVRSILRYLLDLPTYYDKINPVFQSVRPTAGFAPNKGDWYGNSRYLKIATTTNYNGNFTSNNQLVLKNTSTRTLYYNIRSDSGLWKSQGRVSPGQTATVSGLKGLYFVSVTRSATRSEEDEMKAFSGDFEVRLVDPAGTSSNISDITNVTYNSGVGPMLGTGNTLQFKISRTVGTSADYYVVPYLSWDNRTFYEKTDNGTNVTLSAAVSDVTIRNIALTSSGNTLYTKVRIYDQKNGALVWEGPSPVAQSTISNQALSKLEFKKREDSSFLYVNNPEFITTYDILDDGRSQYKKIFEQQDVTGKNAYHQTHCARHRFYGEDYSGRINTNSFPMQSFFMDVDFYNPTNSTVTVTVTNLAYGSTEEWQKNPYTVDLPRYFSGGKSATFEIMPGGHALLFNAPELASDPFVVPGPLNPSNPQITYITMLFDFEVSIGGNVVVSSVAAYDRNNLVIQYGTKNTHYTSGESLTTGEVLYDNVNDPDVSVEKNGRPFEHDIYSKSKGIANQSNWIDANLNFVIGNATPYGPLKVQLSDPYYKETGIWGPSEYWMTQTNPMQEYGTDGVLYAMPESLHSFHYHQQYDSNGNETRWWEFDMFRFNAHPVYQSNSSSPVINRRLSEIRPDLIQSAIENVKTGSHTFQGFPDAGNLGGWGAVYHYTVTVTNNGSSNKKVAFKLKNYSNLVVGYKENANSSAPYVVSARGFGDEWTPVTITVPPGTKTFEIVTLSGAGGGGLQNRLELVQ